MEDRLLVEALRSRDPIAMGAVYDDYAELLYGYCWFQLRSADAAQVAFRDTLMCAEAHVGRLRAPQRFGAWLYALARIECRRRRSAGPVQPDMPVATHDQDDVDLRLMAWSAVSALPPLSREILDLRHRHRLTNPEIAHVTGLRLKEVGELVGQAGVLLEAALIAEILANDGPYTCAGRAALLRRREDEIDDDLREALVRHSLECTRCARGLPEAIAPAKVYGLLPQVPLPPTLRPQIMNCFTDPDLAGYRLFAAARVARFSANGFPQQPGAGRTSALAHTTDRRAGGRWMRALTATAGALMAAVTATALCRYLGQEATHDSHGVIVAPSLGRSPRPSPAPPGHPSSTRPVSAALPFGPPAVAGPVVAVDQPLPKDFLAAPQAADLEVAPTGLLMPAGGTATITLTSDGGNLHWCVVGAGPLRVSQTEGTVQSGMAQVITVRAPVQGPGAAVLTFWPGNRQVRVIWGSRPTPRPPRPPAPTPPSPTPTPSDPPPADPPPADPPPADPPPAPTPTPTNPPPTHAAPPRPPSNPASSPANPPASGGSTSAEPGG